MGHVSLITLGVEDLEVSTRFYAALGWQRSTDSAPGVVAFLRGGTVVLALFGRQALADDVGVDELPTGSGSVALATNVSAHHLVASVLETAGGAGGTVVKPAQRTDWGGTSGYFRDPDGHLWEVAHNPAWPLGQDGRVRLTDDPAAPTADT